MALARSRFLAGVSAAGTVGLPRLATAQASVLRVASTSNDSFAEALYAQDEGFFKRAGLDVEVTVLGNGAAIAAAAAGGAIDVGITNVLPLASAVAHGVPFQFICSGGLVNPDEVSLCVAADSPIRTAKDLDGKTVGSASLNDTSSLALRAWMDRNGGDSATLRTVVVSFAEMAAALRRGTIDAGPIVEPVLSLAKKAGGIRLLVPHLMDVYGKGYMVGGWFARGPWIEQNRATVRRFVDVIYATGRWANAHPDASIAILAKYAKLDPAVLRSMAREEYGARLTPGMIQPALDLAYRYKVIDRPLSGATLIARV